LPNAPILSAAELPRYFAVLSATILTLNASFVALLLLWRFLLRSAVKTA